MGKCLGTYPTESNQSGATVQDQIWTFKQSHKKDSHKGKEGHWHDQDLRRDVLGMGATGGNREGTLEQETGCTH